MLRTSPDHAGGFTPPVDTRLTTPSRLFDDAAGLIRKQCDEALASLAALVDASEDAIVGKTLDGTIVSWNTSATRLYGYTAAETVGRPLAMLVPPERQAELSTILERIGRGERIASFETLRLHKDGTPIDVSLTVSLIETVAGQITGAFDVARDITVCKQAEEAVRTLNATLETRIQERTAQLENAVKELEAFSYSVSHDLRAPLRAVNGYSRILLTDYAAQLPEEARSYLTRVQANAEHMGQLIDDLLTFSRLNRQPVQRTLIVPTSLARQALDELAQAGEARVAAVTIEALLPCTGDPGLLRQVFMNLLSNALKFTARQPAPRITVGCHATSSPASPVYFVQDNGVGFDMRYADKLFGVFHRLHRMEDYPGTGVGLALVQRIIHRHGGRIWAEATPDKGATFFFTIGEGNHDHGSH